MATVSYGSIIEKMRGSIRGTTFSSAGGLEVAKGKALVRRPKFPLAQDAKALFARFAPAWRALSIPKRADWATYAATVTFTNSLGQNYKISGFQHFIRNSMFFSLRGTPVVADVPGGSGLPTVSVATLDFSAGDLRLASFAPTFPASSEIRGSVYAPVEQSRTVPVGKIINQFRYAGAGLPVALVADYNLPFGSGADIRAFVVYKFADAVQRVSSDVVVQLAITVV